MTTICAAQDTQGQGCTCYLSVDHDGLHSWARPENVVWYSVDGSMMCEAHPGKEWPHDDCAGPGMPWIVQGRTEIENMLSRGDHRD